MGEGEPLAVRVEPCEGGMWGVRCGGVWEMQQSRVRTMWEVTAGLGRGLYSTWWDCVGGLDLWGGWGLVARGRGRRGV